MIIDSDSKLRKYIPNALATAKGEVSLYDKVKPFLEQSEKWVIDFLTGSGVIANANSNEMAVIERIIVNDAMYHALPSLDVVLTPNGFGIVSNSNIAPASKERVERLVAKYEAVRDANVFLLLENLPSHEDWMASEQGKFFYATLFPNLTLVKNCGINEHILDNYLLIREQVILIEAELEEAYFSKELMDRFRKEVCLRQYEGMYDQYIVGRIKPFIINKVKGNMCHPQYLADLINIIRNNPETYPEWQNSSVAKLFEPEVFVNSKDSHGYFF